MKMKPKAVHVGANTGRQANGHRNELSAKSIGLNYQSCFCAFSADLHNFSFILVGAEQRSQLSK
jgi:hypothetical protein